MSDAIGDDLQQMVLPPVSDACYGSQSKVESCERMVIPNCMTCVYRDVDIDKEPCKTCLSPKKIMDCDSHSMFKEKVET